MVKILLTLHSSSFLSALCYTSLAKFHLFKFIICSCLKLCSLVAATRTFARSSRTTIGYFCLVGFLPSQSFVKLRKNHLSQHYSTLASAEKPCTGQLLKVCTYKQISLTIISH